MARNTNKNKGRSNSKHSSNKKGSSGQFRNRQNAASITKFKKMTNKHMGKHLKKKTFKDNCINESSGKAKNKFNLTDHKYDSSGSESEPDAFSQLVSCFSNSTKNDLILTDEDSATEEEDVEMEGKYIIARSLDKEENMLAEILPKGSLSSKINNVNEDSDNISDYSNSEEDQNDVLGISSSCDPFESHIQYDLDDNLYEAVSSIPQKTEDCVKNWPTLGQLKIALPIPSSNTLLAKQIKRIDNDVVYAKPGNMPNRIEHVSDSEWTKLFIKSQIQGNVLRANRKYVEDSLNESDQLTSLQKELFSIINNYQDLYYPERTLNNGEEVRFVYCLHTVNHILKTRLKIVHHNARLANKQDEKSDIPDEFRDQGLIRPKVLILVPFRDSALRVVEMLSSILLEEGNNNVLNKKRFYDEFTAGEIAMPRKNPKPEDYERTFSGDTDDNFKIGISVTKKSLKLYADFYSADIIVASPLGLRMIVGAEGQADRDYDFLASIELLVLDQAEIILMQNWDHLLHVWDHIHMQPRESHGTNFARVRPWALSGRTRFYRQTLVFCSHALPQISALFLRKCHNYAGKISVINPIKTGTICQIVLQLPQVFNRIDCTSATDSIDARFNYFVNKVLPHYKEPLMNHTVIYVPSYFDYVRIRNYFKKETVSFVQICEYSKDAKIARARDMFFHSSAHFLLYSERFHFFRRIRLKGIQHVVFYQPPTIPYFYSEICNLMQLGKQAEEGSLSVSVLYTKYDSAQLAAIVGSERAGRMLASDRDTHMFMTGD